ncbi:chromate resistance protein ChrB domain-containing protein [Nodosilinea sp. PGN35]|uniref:chromate resistance protein ChrB domain-containing protein n=1 Tax=Nodosilinea sp. PGN35 TaxID=3020489 RepID=UPI0023B32915|nr:chromate resistance protein ChrB domain-containing protein [Nodosilinea sp. TSF1-S3]MDF0366328.1 chromate resistance protein [Nodosilinea sp. TSF1-S3]
MSWLVFSYSLPTKGQSSPRVTLWRRLKKAGAVSTKTGLHILPHRDDCLEALQWLAQEVRSAQGEALILEVGQFDGLTDPEIVELFHQARRGDYNKIRAEALALGKEAEAKSADKAAEEVPSRAIAKLRKRYNDTLQIDFFGCPEAAGAAAALLHAEQALAPPPADTLGSTTLAAYQNRRWITRPRPFIDRLACAWLIRRFIDADAAIRYGAEPEADEIAFDMPNAEFGHQGNRCSFEVMVQRFGLDKPGLLHLAELVHELDLHDGLYPHPEADGVETLVRGWQLMNVSDQELEAQGLALFDGLYAHAARLAP